MLKKLCKGTQNFAFKEMNLEVQEVQQIENWTSKN